MSKRWQDILAFLIFGVIAGVLLNKALLPNFTLLPLDIIQSIAPWDDLQLGPLANPLISDPFYSFYPRRLFFTESLRSGQFPLWNPAIMTGTPTVANPNFQPFYPPNLIAALILPAQHALPWLAWFHLTATGSLMYLFLRRHKLRWLACTLGGGLWLLSGYNLVWLENPHRLSTAAWIPGILWAYEAATQEDNPGWAALGGVFLALSILGGQMQYVFGIGLVLGLYGLVKTVLYVRGARKVPYKPVLYLLLIGAIGLGIGALMVLPAGEFAAISQRIQASAGVIEGTRWPLTQLVTLIAPDYYGNPVGPVGYWGPVNYAEMTAYFGVVGLLLALTALFIGHGRTFRVYALVLATAALAIILGTPLARLLFLLPGAEFVVLGRLLFLIPLVGAMLAAAGLDAWLASAGNGKSRRAGLALALALAIMVTVSILTAVALGGQFADHREGILDELGRSAGLVAVAAVALLLLLRWPKAAGVLLIVVALGELLAWGREFNPITPVAYLYPENRVVESLQEDSSLFRVLPLQSGKVVFGPNVLSVFGLHEIGGYTPLIEENYYELFKSIDDRVEIDWMAPNRNMLVMSHFDPLVSLLNVKYVLSADALPFEIVPLANHEGCSAPAPLGEKNVTQAFRATHPGLNRVDLTFVELSDPADGQVDFRLWQGSVDGELVARHTVGAKDLTFEGPETYFFAPVPDSAGQTFVLDVTGPAGLALCRSDEGQLQFAAFATWLQLQGVEHGVWIYENPNVQPRAFMVHHVVERPPEGVLETLHDPEFNWYHSAILETDLPVGQRSALSPTPIPSRSQVSITNYETQELEVLVEGESAGLLVLSDAFYPGWVATIDGEPVELYRANSTMRGVFVPPGSHVVQFHFEPTQLPLALALAGISLAAAIFLIVRAVRGRRAKSTAANCVG